jgi:type I restriction-modification system DNA methylase subunit
MTEHKQKQLGKTQWAIADLLCGSMDADDFRDDTLSFHILRYLSDNCQEAAQKELGRNYPKVDADAKQVPLAAWYAANAADVPAFEKQMRRICITSFRRHTFEAAWPTFRQTSCPPSQFWTAKNFRADSAEPA